MAFVSRILTEIMHGLQCAHAPGGVYSSYSNQKISRLSVTAFKSVIATKSLLLLISEFALLYTVWQNMHRLHTHFTSCPFHSLRSGISFH